MEQHSVDTAKCSACYRYLKKARSAPAPHVHGTVARQVDGTFIAQLNCPRTAMVLPLNPVAALRRRGCCRRRPPSSQRPVVLVDLDDAVDRLHGASESVTNLSARRRWSHRTPARSDLARANRDQVS